MMRIKPLLAVIAFNLTLPVNALAETDLYQRQALFEPTQQNDKLTQHFRAVPLDDPSGMTSRLPFRLSFGADVGMRTAHFDWSIASDMSGHKTPDTLSELSYDNLSIMDGGGMLALSVTEGRFEHTYIETQLRRGRIQDGNIRDSDYDGNDKTREYSRSYSDPAGSGTFEFDANIGRDFYVTDNVLFRPLIGYSYQTQNFLKQDGEQIVSTYGRTPKVGAFNGLASTYDTQWNALTLGADTQYHGERYVLGLRAQLLMSAYYGEADWNLRSDFAHPRSFAHWANGTGSQLTASYAYRLTKNWWLKADGYAQNLRTRDGVDTVFFNSGKTSSTKLNETQWRTSGATFAIQYQGV
jgi:hypothetical protein